MPGGGGAVAQWQNVSSALGSISSGEGWRTGDMGLCWAPWGATPSLRRCRSNGLSQWNAASAFLILATCLGALQCLVFIES